MVKIEDAPPVRIEDLPDEDSYSTPGMYGRKAPPGHNWEPFEVEFDEGEIYMRWHAVRNYCLPLEEKPEKKSGEEKIRENLGME